MLQFVSEGSLLSSRKAASVADHCRPLTSLSLAKIRPVLTATESSLPAAHLPVVCIQNISQLHAAYISSTFRTINVSPQHYESPVSLNIKLSIHTCLDPTSKITVTHTQTS